MKYNWQREDWPTFHYKLDGVQDLLSQFSEKTGRVDGLLTALPDSLQTDAVIDLMVSEAIKTSEIEGEMLSRPDVMSSIRNNLGLHSELKPVGDRRAEGVAELMIDARNSYAKPLSQKMLFEWHAMLMKGTRRVKAGGWRTHSEPMVIVSGSIGYETVHYEAPPSKDVPREMKRFVQWFNQSAPGGTSEIKPSPVRAAIAHLYFESIHPFEDGNGRIGRAIAQKALSQSMGRPALLSLSKAINAERANYYAALKTAQHSMEITDWVFWFVRMLLQAQEQAEAEIEFTLKKVKLFDRIRNQLNDRQLKVLQRMLKEGPEGFLGGLSAKKYIAIAKTSKPTATRDLQDLVGKQILIPSGGGRSTHYQINF
ncbi:MAG: Fic family protein [Kiritimatiellales bacterium]|nr:Fic family protein [Kiritimatiellota bacterium]MBL7012540.1 Fic family protein [Kiritimatiellales bacterium]